MFERKDNGFYQEEKATNGVALLLIGVAIGAAVALLYAPKSGEEARGLIGDKASDLRDSASDWGHDLSDRAGDWKGLAKRKFQELQHRS